MAERVLIVALSVGGGHASAGRAVEAALRLYRGGAEASILDDESILEAVVHMERRVGELADAPAGARRAAQRAPICPRPSPRPVSCSCA